MRWVRDRLPVLVLALAVYAGVATSRANGSYQTCVPIGTIVLWSGTLASIPANWQLCDGSNGTPDLRNSFAKCVGAAENPGATGGASSASYTPEGSCSTPTFTGSALGTHSHGAGTYAAGDHTYTPAGTNGTSSCTPLGTVAWPVGVPTAAGEAAHTHAVTAAGTNGTVSFTPVGTIAWPAGVPTAANESAHTHSVTSNVAVPDHSSHTHTYTDVPNHTHTIQMQGSTTAATTGVHIMNSTATGGSSRASTSPDATNNPTGGVATGTTAGPSATLTHAVTNNAVTSGAGAAHTHTLSWPAGVPTLTGSSGTVSAQTFTGSQVTSGAGASHTHTLSWPAGVPTMTGSSSTVSAQTFTGTQATLSHSLSGSSAAVSAGTPAGSVSAPSFTGSLASIATEPVFYKLAFIQRVR